MGFSHEPVQYRQRDKCHGLQLQNIVHALTRVADSIGPATRNDFVNDIVNDARADAIFATLKAIVDDEKSTISSTISLRVAWP